MTRPWQTLDRVPTDEGELVLLQRGERDYMIKVGGRVLMVSQGSGSERALATLACEALGPRPAPRVLIGGLGMAITLRAALQAWPDPAAAFVVSEINPQVVTWCRGPLAELTDNALDDPRVSVQEEDVAETIRRAAGQGGAAHFDAVLLDLYQGPNAGRRGAGEAHYGNRALGLTRRALRPGGALAVWSEEPDAAFEKRLAAAGLRAQKRRPDGGGRRHVIYLAIN
jgi:spermidine synthase